MICSNLSKLFNLHGTANPAHYHGDVEVKHLLKLKTHEVSPPIPAVSSLHTNTSS